MSRRLKIMVLVAAVAAPAALLAQERIDAAANAKIRKEGIENSQIMRTMHFLADVYGPRLTGSPNYKAAAEWAIRQMTEWGLANGHLEPWDFGHPGWTNERFSIQVLEPFKDHLAGEVLAWTPGTTGPVTAQAVTLELPEKPTKETLTAFLESVRSRVKGRIVLIGKHQPVPPIFAPPPARLDWETLHAQMYPRTPAPPTPPGPAPQPAGPPGVLTARQVDEIVDPFLVAAGALVRVNDAARPNGMIRAFNNRTFDVTKAVPTFVLRSEDYGRLWRLATDGAPVTLEVNIVNTLHPEGKTTYNVVAELPGTDKADEAVLVGGHLDSWHTGTGAVDNAIGCAVGMEAVRILKAAGLRPRRTIRVTLWSAEEQGLLGSKAYVAGHYGTFEQPKPDYGRFGGYLNMDSGTGQIRGLSVFGPQAAADVLRALLAPFYEFGVVGAMATRSRNPGGTDSTSFNAAGLPGIGMRQDPIEYSNYHWHTPIDTYERILEDDVKRTAVVMASVAYHLAMRDELLPRFTKEEMPAPPKQ